MNFQRKIAIAVVFLITQLSFAQKKDENIGTEVVNVVKPYTPTISDAFKVKETPTIDDEDNSKKENIQYNIFSFPVAHLHLQKEKQPVLNMEQKKNYSVIMQLWLPEIMAISTPNCL